MREIKLEVNGMSCSHCEARITKNIKAINGIKEVSASALNNEVLVVYDEILVDIDQIKNTVKETGYIVK